MKLKNKIIDILKECYDPEIPIDVWNLGLIYNIEVNEQLADITMTLTTPGCTMAEHIANNIKTQIKNNCDVKDVKINITFDPIWEPSFMTDFAKEKLGLKMKKKKSNWE